jgi:predicted PP-loop superfamily ATPase
MFKWLMTAALALSVLVCAYCELAAQRTLRERRAMIAIRRAELEPLRAIANEVAGYERMKEALMQRIDAINRQKQNQKGAAEAVARLAGVDPTGVESVAAVDGRNLVVNRR